MTKHLVLILFVLSNSVACATAGSDLLPRVGNGLMAVKDAYAALCEPVPSGKEAACENARIELNRAIDAYSKLNDLVEE